LPVADAIEAVLDNEAEDQTEGLILTAADLIVSKVEEGASFQVGLAIGWVLNPTRTGVPVPNFVPHVGPADAELMAKIFAMAISKGLEKDGNSSGVGEVPLAIAGGFEHGLFSCEFAVQNDGLTAALPATTDVRELVATKCCPIINEPLKKVVRDPSFKSDDKVLEAFEAAILETSTGGHPNIDVSLCDPYGKKDAEGSRVRSILNRRVERAAAKVSG